MEYAVCERIVSLLKQNFPWHDNKVHAIASSSSINTDSYASCVTLYSIDSDRIRKNGTH